MQILIIVPPFTNKPASFYNLPMGLLYLATVLENLGHHVVILNLNESSDGDYERVIRYNVQNTDVIMIGGLSVFYNVVKSIITIIRKYSCSRIVVGGGLVTSQPEFISKHLDADHFVSGECEDVVQDVLKFDKRVYYAKGQVQVEKLNTLMPAYHLFNMELYLGLQRPSDGHYRSIVDNPRESALIASRGCPYQCTFCFHPTGLKYRARSLNSVFKEIDILVENYNINILAIYDELFSISKERLVDFCERIKKYKLFWSCQLRVDSVTEDDLAMMKDSGCYILSLGIESGSNAILKSYKKGITVAQIDKTLELTKKIGIAVQGNILIGAEAETRDTVCESLEWWKKHAPYKFALTYVIPYPGTELYKNAVVNGKIDELAFLEAGCPTVNCTTLSDNDSKEINDELITTWNSVNSMAFVSNQDLVLTADKFDSYGRAKLSFDATCPYCKTVDRRHNFALDGLSNGIFFCRNCFMRYHFKTV